MKIVSIKRVQPEDVYNLEVEGTHSFVIQGGVISHNCMDEARYLCMSRPIKPRANGTAIKHHGDDPLNMFHDAVDAAKSNSTSQFTWSFV